MWLQDRNAPVYALGHGDNKNKSSNGLSTEAGDQRELDTQQLPRPSSSASQPARPLPQTAIVSTENGRSELGLLRKSACPTEQKLVIKQSILQIITHPSRVSRNIEHILQSIILFQNKLRYTK